MENLDWTTDELRNIADQICTGLEDILERTRIDAAKPIYENTQTKAQFNVILRHPASARIVAISERTGNEIELYVCPVAPPVGKPGQTSTFSHPVRPHDRQGRMFASYLSPLGQLGSCLPNEVCQDFCVIEREDLNPIFDKEGIVDSNNTTVNHADHPIKTIVSLRALLKSSSSVTSRSWLDEEDSVIQSDELVVEGSIRKVNRSFGLQNILVNRIQDEIFRAPIESQTILLGAPGTGKTTTMTLRLKAKMYLAELSNNQKQFEPPTEEQKLIKNLTDQGYARNWILFTPTELLKQYVRNALDNQGLGELNQQMSTWDDFSYPLAMNVFGLLRTNTKPGVFILNNAKTRLSENTIKNPIGFFEAFESFKKRQFVGDFNKAVRTLCQSNNEQCLKVGLVLKPTADLPNVSPLDVIALCHDCEATFDAALKKLNADSDAEIKAILRDCDARIPNLENKWYEQLKKEQVLDSIENDEDLDEDEEDEAPNNQAGLQPIAELKKTIRLYCQSILKAKPYQANSKIGKRIDTLSDGLPDKALAKKIGTALQEISVIRRLKNSFKRYLTCTCKTYKSFMQSDLGSETPNWFVPIKMKNSVINSTELDLLILDNLQMLQEMIKNRRMQSRYKSELEEKVKKFCRMMVFIDECTDFSPIQLACMNALAIPSMRSVFASGDLNQRLTRSGIKFEKELQWAIPGADIHRLEIAFRQSRKLYEFGERILALDSEGIKQLSHTNESVKDSGVPPALQDYLGSLENIAEWTAQRIVEMQMLYKDEMPTTAIFVQSRDEVEKFSELLANTDAFIENNLRSQACRDGQAVGSDMKICVYPIEHVKGLEFESCFFIAIDELAKEKPELFDRYLYVGVTRAATFLGIACSSALPTKLEDLRPLTVENWK